MSRRPVEELPVPRAPRPEDLYDLRVPVDLRLSPDGRHVAFTLKETAPGSDGYRHSLWLVPADGSAPARRLTLGARTDTCPRWSPDGRAIAFISDRGAVLAAGGAPLAAEDLEPHPGPGPRDAVGREVERGRLQVWLLPMAGGEAQRLTRLPDDASELAWSPDGSRLCVVAPDGPAATPAPDRRSESGPRRPPPDARLIDELGYMLNGEGFIHDRPPKLWLVDAVTGRARRLTSGPWRDGQPAWSPDGRRICFVSARGRDRDVRWRSDIHVVDADGGRPVRVSGGRERVFHLPAWSPDGRTIAVTGHRIEAMGQTREDVWLFSAEPLDDGRNITAHVDLFVAAMANSDLLGFAPPRLLWEPVAEALLFAAPIEGSYELWRVRLADGRVERLTEGEHLLLRPDAVPVRGGLRVAAVRVSGHEPPDVVSLEVPALAHRPATPVSPDRLRRLTDLQADAWAGITLARPVSRWHEAEGRRIQGWLLEAAPHEGRPAPLVVEIHGGPQTLYGWSLMWEWQVLVAAGISVYACNPRGSQGYGQELCSANFRDWGEGPMADVMAGVDALVAEGLADPHRLGVTGGSYGGYLAAWMIGHTDRFAAAVACRGVYDMTAEMLSGDIGGPLFGRYEYGANPWEDPELYRLASPITYAHRMRTPLLIQHAEQDLRCPITQAEELFAVLRSMGRPVRLMRVPGESHELTRSGTPHRRVENLVRIRDWFVHFLVAGRRDLPRA